jgi:DNA primase
MGRIPEATVEQVLVSTDIVELVGRYVKLRRAGTNFVGLCPFHNEKTPSFNVSPSRNSYHCFGCGAGGTALGFLMDHDGMTFVEAVKRLADAAGIRIEEEVWDANAEKDAKIRAGLVRAHQRLAEWYHHLLMKDPVADVARQYLKGRGINAQVAKRWQLGFAPNSGDLMRRWAREHDISENLLIDAGVLAKGERGDTYPRFRQRLMFPICNDNGEVIAFSGRLLDADAKAAKYMNSPETPIFNKSRVFFGFHKAKRAVAKASQAIVCEGQIDLVMAFEAGFENVVAALGTAFTEHHAKLLKRHADEVVLCYDSDAAGFKAAQRAFQILAPTGLVVKVAALPTGDDPDTLIRREGAAAFAGLIERAEEFIDYQIAHAAAQPKFNQMVERVRFAEQMAANIRLLDNPVARSTAIQRVAVRMGIPEEDIRKRIGKPGATTKVHSSSLEEAKSEAGRLLKEQDRTAMMLCQSALASQEVLDWLRSTAKVDWLDDIPGTELLSVLWRSECRPLDAASMTGFLSSLDPVLQQAIVSLQFQPAPPGGLSEAAEALKALELVRIQHQISRVQTQLKAPGLSAEQAAGLQQEMLTWRKEYLDRRAASLDTPRFPPE